MKLNELVKLGFFKKSPLLENDMWAHTEHAINMLWDEYVERTHTVRDTALSQGTEVLHTRNQSKSSMWNIADKIASDVQDEFDYLIKKPFDKARCQEWLSPELKTLLADALDDDDRQKVYDELYDLAVNGLT